MIGPKCTSYGGKNFVLLINYSHQHEGGWMQKLFVAGFILIILAALQTKAFAKSSFTGLNCSFKNGRVNNIQTLRMAEDYLIINSELEIPLEVSRVKCGNFGKQVRFDGLALGYQVILKSCSSEAKLEGHLIDSLNDKVAEVICK
jgi:hypothetical protein